MTDHGETKADSCSLIPGACEPCTGTTPRLTTEETARYLEEVSEWTHDGQRGCIERMFWCRDFADAIDFLNQVALVADREGHHPDVRISRYRNLTFTLRTHAIKGLSVNDFVVAKLIDALWANRPK